MPTKDEIKQFSQLIEAMAFRLNCTHMDAIVDHCKQTGLELEVASTLISPRLKSFIRDEAHNLNMLKKEGAKLPI